MLQYMLETSFSSFIRKKTDEIPIFKTFFVINSILAYISLKIAKLGKIGSHTRYLYHFGMFGKKCYTMVPNKHTSGVCFSSS